LFDSVARSPRSWVSTMRRCGTGSARPSARSGQGLPRRRQGRQAGQAAQGERRAEAGTGEILRKAAAYVAKACPGRGWPAGSPGAAAC